MMHTCPAPQHLLARWLNGGAHTNNGYGHILLEQVIPADGDVIADLRPYFESAHMDAREVFHTAGGGAPWRAERCPRRS
jgi:hypothetical protein